MVSKLREFTVILVLILGMGMNFLSWIIFHHWSVMCLSGCVTIISLLAVIIPKDDNNLSLSAAFLIFDVGLSGCIIIGGFYSNSELGLICFAEGTITGLILLLLSGLAIHSRVENLRDMLMDFIRTDQCDCAKDCS